MPPAATPATTAPPEDASELDKKQKELLAVKSSLEEATKKVAALTGEIKTLEGLIMEVKKTYDLYATNVQLQQKELDNQQRLISQKATMAAAGIKDQKDAIDKVVRSVDDEIDSQAKKVAAAQKSTRKAQDDVTAAETSLKQKQDEYAGLKQTQKLTDDQIKRIRSLTDQAAKSQLQGEIAGMYFLLQEASHAAKDVALIPPGDFLKKVTAAQSEIENARATLATKKAESETQVKVLADTQSGAISLTTGRQATILSKLKQIKVDGEPTAPPPQTASRTQTPVGTAAASPASAPEPGAGQQP